MLYLMALSDAIGGAHDQAPQNIASFSALRVTDRACYWHDKILGVKITYDMERNWSIMRS